MKPRVIGLDFVDTLYQIDWSGLSETEFGGRHFRSTIPLIFELLKPRVPNLTLDRLCQVVFEAYRDAEVERAATFREVPSEDIFSNIVRTLGPTDDPSALALEAGRLHHAHLERALVLPTEHSTLLNRLREEFVVGLISNFDSAEVVRAVLERDGLTDALDAIIISADVGWRKPHLRIFEAFTDRLGVLPPEVLFVGDHYEFDVIGARNAGMRSVWLRKESHNGEPNVAEAAAPERGPTLAALTELPVFIETLSSSMTAPQEVP